MVCGIITNTWYVCNVMWNSMAPAGRARQDALANPQEMEEGSSLERQVPLQTTLPTVGRTPTGDCPNKNASSHSNENGPAVISVCFEAAVIIPMYNVESFIVEALESVLGQQDVAMKTVELVMYDDTSTDDTVARARTVVPRLAAALGSVKLLSGAGGPRGCGYARNRATEASNARVLVFLDSDDMMMPERLHRTLEALPVKPAEISSRSLAPAGNASHEERQVVGVVGGNFVRYPAGSTPRYQDYHTSISGTTAEASGLFPFAFRDAPLAMPTVACLRSVWDVVDGFVEIGTAISEDLHFMYAAMEHGYCLRKLEGTPLLWYRYHENMTSRSLARLHMLSIRVAAFEKLVLERLGWKTFSIWGAGRDGKDFFKLLSSDAKRRVTHWGEVNPRKIGKIIYEVPVLHWRELEPPIATCVALDRRNREFEKNLEEKQLRPGRDFVYMI